LQAKKPAWRFHALDLIGVAAAVCAAVSAHPTKPIVASELAEAKYPAAFPPQWLPVLLATASTSGLPLPIEPYLPNPGCTARYAVNESLRSGDLAAAWSIEVKSNNATIGFLVKSGVNASTSCDQLAAIVINEETNEEQIIGVSSLIENWGYSLGWFASEGEEIRFRYWDGEAEEEYFGLERFIMTPGDTNLLQGNFSAGFRILDVQEVPPCKCQLCTHVPVEYSFRGVYPPRVRHLVSSSLGQTRDTELN